jgi:hypothetical protein
MDFHCSFSEARQENSRTTASLVGANSMLPAGTPRRDHDQENVRPGHNSPSRCQRRTSIEMESSQIGHRFLDSFLVLLGAALTSADTFAARLRFGRIIGMVAVGRLSVLLS